MIQRMAMQQLFSHRALSKPQSNQSRRHGLFAVFHIPRENDNPFFAAEAFGKAEWNAVGNAAVKIGFSVTGFSDGGEADAPERSATGFQDDSFCAVHRG